MKIDHNTGNYVPYSFRIVCGFFNVPQGRWAVYQKRIMIWDLKLPLAELKRRDRGRGTIVLLDPVYTRSDKFLNGQKFARIHLSLRRDQRNPASFWTANSTVICYRICGVPYKLVAQVKNSSVQKFDRTRVNQRGLISRTEHKRLLQISCYLVILVNFVSLLKFGPLLFVFHFFNGINFLSELAFFAG